jgi:hypothetical protein
MWRRLLLVSTLAGCSLLTNLDTLATDTSDASTDVATDAGTDSPGPDGGDGGKCSPPAFCDDFDQGALGARWSGVQTSSFAALSLSNDAVSPPNAFSAVISAGSPASDRVAMLTEQFPTIKSLDCTFEMQILQTSTTERINFFSVYVNNPSFSGYQFNVFINPDGTSLLEEWAVYPDGGSFITGQPFGKLAQKTWLHMEVIVDYTASARVFADGSPLAAIKMVTQTPVSEMFMFGVHDNGTGAWSVLFDDLVCMPTF